ncbi:unnamed protein product, partial [Amoebophrya sp. A25]|eukprot:GSA25T00024625001.1
MGGSSQSRLRAESRRGEPRRRDDCCGMGAGEEDFATARITDVNEENQARHARADEYQYSSGSPGEEQQGPVFYNTTRLLVQGEHDEEIETFYDLLDEGRDDIPLVGEIASKGDHKKIKPAAAEEEGGQDIFDSEEQRVTVRKDDDGRD